MSLRSVARRPLTWIVAIPVAVILAAVVGPFIYINFIKADAPDHLSLADATSDSTAATDGSSATTTGASAGAAGEPIDGRWTVAKSDKTVAGYRVKEVLFGQDTEAVGRTSDVTGEVTIEGTTISTASFTVDLTTIKSDEDRRDNQFRGRIMDTSSFPTATFRLTQPITLASEPANVEPVKVTATGQLTIRDVTKEVTFELSAQRNGNAIAVNGTIPVKFADYGIPDASFGPATVQDHGEIEFLLELARA